MSKLETLTYSQKKYLFAIYKLGQNGDEVKSAEVSKIVGVSKASTVAMTSKLCEIGYIEKERYGQIALTKSGIEAANSIFTNSLIIREFLEKNLSLDGEKADSDSIKIVSHISEEAVNLLVDYILENVNS